MPLHSSPKLLQVKIQGQNEEMLLAACEQFLGKSEEGIQQVALETLEGHQRAIMGSMTVEVRKTILHCNTQKKGKCRTEILIVH